MASTVPSFARMTDWLMTFNRSASSCASTCVVMMGRMVLPVKVVSALAFCFAFLARSNRDHVRQLQQCELIVPSVEELLNAFACEFPANIFESVKIWEIIPRAKNEKKNKRTTDWREDQLCQQPSFPSPFPPPWSNNYIPLTRESFFFLVLPHNALGRRCGSVGKIVIHLALLHLWMPKNHIDNNVVGLHDANHGYTVVSSLPYFTQRKQPNCACGSHIRLNAHPWSTQVSVLLS